MDKFRKIVTFVVLMALTSATGFAGPVSTELIYTTFSGGQNVWSVQATYTGDGTSGNGNFTLTNDTNIASTPGADGIVRNPNNGKLLVGGQGSGFMFQINSNGSFTTASAGVHAFHLVVDPNLQVVWASDIPGKSIASVPINPFGPPGTARSISGDDNTVTTLEFAPNGTVFYTSAGAGGHGNFGTIDLMTGVTTRYITNLPAAHGMLYDPFTGHLILGGANQIAEIDPLNPSVVAHSVFIANTFVLDQGALDGKGHLYWADNAGTFLFMDYSNTKDVGDPNNFSSSLFFKGSLDDIAPLIGAGGTSIVSESSSIALFVLAIAMLGLTRRSNLRTIG